MPFLVSLLTWAMSGFIARVLVGAGFAILGSMTFSSFVNYFIDKLLSQMSNIPFIGLLGLAGIDKAISIMITSMLIRIYLSSVVQTVKIVKK